MLDHHLCTYKVGYHCLASVDIKSGVRFKCPKKNKALCHFTPCVILSCVVCNQSSVVVRQIAGSLPTFVVGMTKDMDHYEPIRSTRARSPLFKSWI